MAACTRTPQCPGVVDETGFCDACGLAPLIEPGSIPGPVSPGGDPGTAYRDVWTVAKLVSLPVLPFSPEARAVPNLEVPEQSRFCGNCRRAIGRSAAGRPALDRGFCPSCGTRFSFVPDLQEGDLVGQQYEVVRCLARGGLGWVYLAVDTHLDRAEVVLKGLINRADTRALQTAVSERRFLTALDHPNIVRIRDFVIDRDRVSGEQAGYIVMEYLNGLSLSELERAAADPRQPDVTLPLDHILAYGHEILAALDYLHHRDLLYTDMKPANVVRTADRIKVIDLGGVRHVHDRDSPMVNTADYQVSQQEIAERGPTVRSDLHALGVTLDELFGSGTPGPHGSGTAAGGLAVESFRRLVRRAAHRDWDRRFVSAAEMSGQLVGVLREVVPAHLVQQQPDVSALFAPAVELLDTGLGAVLPLRTWTAATNRESFDDGRPDGHTVASGLPTPRSAPDDQNTGVLDALGTLPPGDLLAKLSALKAVTMEVELWRCRAHLRLAQHAAAGVAVDVAEAQVAPGSPHRWRIAWHRGLLALAGGKPEQAGEFFDGVYADLPGEVAPKVALGYCAEQLGRPAEAERFYAAVWRRDRLQVSAAFGLARLQLAAGERAAAVAVLDAVPRISGHYEAARIAAVRVFSARLPTGPPDAAHLNEAVRRIADLRLDGGDQRGAARDRLVTAIREAALDRLQSLGPDGLDGGEVLGQPPSEHTLRRLLEASFRAIATQATALDEHGVLIDRANAVRAWSAA